MSLRAAIYARVSTAKQAEEGHSLDAQKALLTKVAEQHGWKVVAVYEDTISGSRYERPGLQALLNDLDSRAFGVVLVADQDRLSRMELVEWEVLKSHLREHNVLLATPSGLIDFDDEDDEFVSDLLNLLARRERKKIVARSTQGLRHRAEQGLWPSGPPPYGYRIHPDGYLVKDPETRLIVEGIFSDVLTYSIGPLSLSRRLNARNIPSPRGGRWWDNVLHRILKNPVYAGKIEWGGHLYPGRHEPYITEQEHAAILRDLSRRRTQPRKTSNSLVTGYALCGVCGQSIRRTYSGPKMYEYYICLSLYKRYNRMVEHDCGLGLHRVDEVDAKIEQALLAVAIDEQALQDALRDRLHAEDRQRSALEERIKVLDQQVRDLETRVERYMEAFEVGDLPADILKDRLAELHSRHEQKTQEIATLREQLLSVPDPEAEFARLWPLVRDLPSRWRSPNMTPEERRALVRAIFSSVVLLPGGQVRYHLFV